MSYAHRHPSPYRLTTIKELTLRAMRRGPLAHAIEVAPVMPKDGTDQ